MFKQGPARVNIIRTIFCVVSIRLMANYLMTTLLCTIINIRVENVSASAPKGYFFSSDW